MSKLIIFGETITAKQIVESLKVGDSQKKRGNFFHEYCIHDRSTEFARYEAMSLATTSGFSREIKKEPESINFPKVNHKNNIALLKFLASLDSSNKDDKAIIEYLPKANHLSQAKDIERAFLYLDKTILDKLYKKYNGQLWFISICGKVSKNYQNFINETPSNISKIEGEFIDGQSLLFMMDKDKQTSYMKNLTKFMCEEYFNIDPHS